jgi:hypothetical protein
MKRLVIFGALFLAACATVAMTVDKAPEQTNQVRDTNYTLGVERTVVVGNPIVRVRDYLETITETASMEATESFQLTGGIVTILFQRGERLPIFGQRVTDGTTYTVARKDRFGIQIAPDGSIGPGVINGLGTDVQVVMAYRFSPSSPTARFNRVVDRNARSSQSGQNFEIVFNGIDGQAMHFQYREYTADDLARPAFSQDLSYPLSTRTIRFRDLVIAVASVNAEEIRHTVVADGRPSS